MGFEDGAEKRLPGSLPTGETEIGPEHGSATTVTMAVRAQGEFGVEKDTPPRRRIGFAGHCVEPCEPRRGLVEGGTVRVERSRIE